MQVGIEDLNIGIILAEDAPGSDYALALRVDPNSLRAFAVELGIQALDVEDDLGDILLDALDGGKLMLDAIDFHRNHSNAGKRGEKHTS